MASEWELRGVLHSVHPIMLSKYDHAYHISMIWVINDSGLLNMWSGFEIRLRAKDTLGAKDTLDPHFHLRDDK